MNEQIKKLIKQAHIYPYMELNDFRRYETTDFYLNQFAELIVKECVFISRTSTDGFSAGRRMEEHFGVE